MKPLVIFFVAILCLSTATEAHAARLHFGNKDELRILQDVSVTSPKGEDLFLAHRITTTYFLLGVWVQDNGYVLAIKGGEGYYPMPDDKTLKLMQAAKLLPNPLPAYKLREIDYIMGYSMYIFILVIGVWVLFQKTFGRKKQSSQPPAIDAKKSPMENAIRNQEKTDPLARPKIIAKEIVHRFIKGMADQKGVHIESLITSLAALGGFSCQMSIREGLVKTGKITEEAAFAVVRTQDGKKYFAGDLLNEPVFSAKLSLYSLVGGTVQQLGGKNFPDMSELAGHVTSSVGTDQFGIPRVPDNHKAADLPINYVKDLWPVTLPILVDNNVNPIHWPVVFGFALQQVVEMGKDTLDPELAFKMVMETAVPMSKINPEDLT